MEGHVVFEGLKESREKPTGLAEESEEGPMTLMKRPKISALCCMKMQVRDCAFNFERFLC